MPLHLVLYFMLGWLIMTLGIAMAIRTYRDDRNLTPEYPSKQHMKRLVRVAFAGYTVLAFGHTALVVTQFHLTNPSINANVVAKTASKN